MRRILVPVAAILATIGERLVRLLRRHLSYANVTATLALFVVLGGTAYAAVVLPRNSVTAKQIQAGAVASSEVKDRALQVRDFSRAARKALKGERGPAGPPGPAGGGGAGGGIAALLTYKTMAGTVPAAPLEGTESVVATAKCDVSQRVTGGGVKLQAGEDLEVRDSYPESSGTGWTVQIENESQTARTFTVYAICTL